jgi:2'-5' RNA ligase
MPHTGAMQSERPAVISLELTFNSSFERYIRAEWQALADAGLSSLAGHTSPSNRPHITLLASASIRPLTRDELSALVTLPMPLTCGAPILFGTGDRRILARSIVPSRALLDFHAELHAIAGDDSNDRAAEERSAALTRPGQWTPHVTLARRMRLDTLPQALRILDDLRAATDVLQVEATTLRRWDAASATVTDLFD